METAEKQMPETSADTSSVSVIGPNITITGNIEASGDAGAADLQIEGRVVGDVRCATVILIENSSVTGNIFAERVRVSGAVEGGIDTNDLAVEETARIGGDVIYDRLRIASGGVVQGSMRWKGAATDSARLKLVETKPESPKAVFID